MGFGEIRLEAIQIHGISHHTQTWLHLPSHTSHHACLTGNVFKVVIMKQILRLINTNAYALGMLLTTSMYFNLTALPRDSFFLVLHQFLLYSERWWRRRQDMPLCLEPAVRKWFCLLKCTGYFVQVSCIFLQCPSAIAHARLWRKVRINAAVLQLFLSEWGRRTVNEIPSPCAVDLGY